MLVSAAPAEAERIAADVLAGLLARNQHERTVLVRPLRTWCANDGSPERTAGSCTVTRTRSVIDSGESKPLPAGACAVLETSSRSSPPSTRCA
jgi:hypothetical protein